MHSASGRSPVVQTRSPSSKSKGILDVGGSLSGVSSAAFGKGPAQQALTLAASLFASFLSSLASVRQPLQRLGEQCDISTFPVLQSTSGLWSFNQVCPRIRFCLLRPVTENRALSECPLYRSRSSATSEIEPPTLALPSTLYTGIGRDSFLVRIWLDFTYSRSMKRPVAPESTNSRTPYFR